MKFCFFFIKTLKSKKKNDANFVFSMLVKKYDWAIQKKLICIDQ